MLEKPRELVDGHLGKLSGLAGLTGRSAQLFRFGLRLPGEKAVRLVDERLAFSRFSMSGMGKRYRYLCDDAARILLHDDDTIPQQNRFFDVVSDHENRFRRNLAGRPEFEQFATKRFRAEHIKGREWVVHAEQLR